MKVLLFILFALIGLPLKAQTTFYYKYKEVCSNEIRTVKVNLENSGGNFTVFFFGEYRTFTLADVESGAYDGWMSRVYRQWTDYYPCVELSALVEETTKKVAEQNDSDVSQPLIIVTSDVAYYSGGDVKFGFGYSEADRLSGVGKGGVGSFGNSKVSSFGLFRITPIDRTLNTVENFNLIITEKTLLGNLLHGVYYKHRLGGVFAFNAMTFGFLNGFGFQDNTLVFGGGGKVYSNNQLNVSTMLVTTYTYHVRLFKISYWFEDHIKLNPNLSITYKVSPSFGLGLSGTMTYRTDEKIVTSSGLLLGGKLFF
jgi:hypothetical protein